jgi:thiol-disulfide isomerase/thioredoxin
VDKIDLSAGLSKEQTKQMAHYETTFRDAVMQDLEGNKHGLSSIEAPVIILNFWASWCAPCLEEMPSLVELRNQFSNEDLMIYGINSDEEDQAKKIEKTVKKFALNYKIVPDNEAVLLNKFMISSIPVTIIFVRGEVMEVSLGLKDFASEEFIQKIKSVL